MEALVWDRILLKIQNFEIFQLRESWNHNLKLEIVDGIFLQVQMLNLCKIDDDVSQLGSSNRILDGSETKSIRPQLQDFQLFESLELRSYFEETIGAEPITG